MQIGVDCLGETQQKALHVFLGVLSGFDQVSKHASRRFQSSC